MNNLTIEDIKEVYELFIFNIDDYIDELTSKAGRSGYFLDINNKFSLNTLEKFILQSKISSDDILCEEAAAYLGEIARLHFGGEWMLNLDDENNSLYYGEPVICGLSPVDGVLYPPLMIIRNFVSNPRFNCQEGVLLQTLEDEINPQPFDLSEFPTET